MPNINAYHFKLAQNPSDFASAKSLFTEYANSLPFDLVFQNFEQELNEIHLQYSLPYGGLILVTDPTQKKPSAASACENWKMVLAN